jgi:hypothetical protein
MDKRIATIAMLAVLGGCAPAVEWNKAGAGPTQAAADEKQCDAIAEHEVGLEMESSHALYPPETETLYAYSGGSMSGHGPKPSYSREGARQYELASYCMKQRGYTLVQVAPRTTS